MQQLVESIELDQLPSLPEILLRILREFSSEILQVRELAGLIGHDSALTLKILAVANSAAYRRQKPITSIEQCISLLGFKMVKMITIGASTQQFLNTLSGIVPVNFTHYWQHSQTSAFLAEMIAESIDYPQSQEAYIAGLLHDVGKLALLISRPQAYQPLFQFVNSGNDRNEQELDLLGITHSEIGAMLVRHWGLEPLVVDAIRYHHESAARIGGASELIKIVALANLLSKIGTETPQHPSLALARGLFDLDAATALRMCADANAKTAALMIPLGIHHHDEPSANPQAPADSRSVSIHRQLAEEVRTSTLLDIAQQDLSAARNEDELLANILKSASILFEPKQAFLFEWDAESNLISGRPIPAHQDTIARLRFPLSAGKSLVADALLTNAMTSSDHTVEFDDRFVLSTHPQGVPSMLDEQILRMADAECIYCVPLATPTLMYGVLVLAFPSSVIERRDGKLRFLTQFARQAAACIESLRRVLPAPSGSGAADVEAHRSHARQIIHEASNPLSILKNYLKVLDVKLKSGRPAELEIQILNEEIDRVAHTIGKLAASPLDQVPLLGKIDVNAAIRDVMTVCDPSILAPCGIKLDARLADKLPLAHSNLNSLKQVLINLFKNAAEAMPGGGMVRVATAFVVDQQRSGAISITFSDDGPGIPADILKNLFSPVVSTKGKHNSGLGLSIVSAIVSQLGGLIRCKSAPGLGASFEITLPLEPDAGNG